MELVYYSNEPEVITYMPLLDGYADVWIRQDITQVEETTTTIDEDGNETETTETYYTANEVYFRTLLSLEEVTENADYLFENEGPVIDVITEEEIASDDTPSYAERIEVAEEAILELAELLIETATVTEEITEKLEEIAETLAAFEISEEDTTDKTTVDEEEQDEAEGDAAENSADTASTENEDSADEGTTDENSTSEDTTGTTSDGTTSSVVEDETTADDEGDGDENG